MVAMLMVAMLMVAMLMVAMLMVMMMLAILMMMLRFLFLYFVERLLYLPDPCGRCGGLAEVEKMRVENLVEVDVAVIAFYYLGVRLYRTD